MKAADKLVPAACIVIDMLRPHAAPVVVKRKRKKYGRRALGHGRINPRTKAEWQEAINASYWALTVDSAFQYGLVENADGTKDSGVNVDRCLRLLEQGAKRGLTPDKDWNP